MAKYYGVIGFIETIEKDPINHPGVYSEEQVEASYYGDVLRNSRRWSASSNSLNDELNINNQISIIADAYAMNNFHAMKYIEYMGAYWKISDVEVQFPRLILTIGGVYSGKQTNPA